MSSSVLYDVPGPRARSVNVLLAVLFVLVLGGAAWWVLDTMHDEGQLAADKWKPFVTDGRVWTTFLLPGLWATVKAALLAIVIALPLGAVLGIARMSDHSWVRVPAGAVVEFFRAIPVLILMIFANEAYARFTDVEPDNRPLYAVVTALVLYNASVLAEVVRAGVQALPRGQTDAALAVGMRKSQLMLYVLLPQAVTAMLPAILSQLVVIVKDTALGGAVLGYSELMRSAGLINANYANLIASLTVVAVIYIVLNYLITSFAHWLEARIRRGKRTTGAVLTMEPHEQTEAGQPTLPTVKALEPPHDRPGDRPGDQPNDQGQT
ncbi:amino acid ABC transporter permease [Streptomyces aidingensis]|uniref:Glutamate transport system permease protein n=1 Tax=Streptomyces aidingensis TaxID=910347 RepID=A0A1I1U8I2_9ACTN|nr:amino acid ABC transporter permease [Streptomyces aidingensis]SFD64220.1 glutamate transport system permease protein [Streptomyces aidingensis]